MIDKPAGLATRCVHAGAVRVVDRLKLFAIASRLGGVESLATMPVTTTHHGLSPAER